MAVRRASCSDRERDARFARRLSIDDPKLAGGRIAVDGFNVLITIETALAGGSIGSNVLLVEAYNSVQASGQVEPLFTRSRYVLLRTTSATPLMHEPEELDIDDLLRRAFGGY